MTAPSATAVIIDDEAACITALQAMLARRHPGVALVGTAVDVPSGVALLKEKRPDLLFLDVELGDMTGFDLLKAIAPLRPQVIFTTAHESYAVKAIRFNALDYLLKPIDPEELDDAVNKAVRERGGHLAAPDRIAPLLGTLMSDRQLALPDAGGLVVLHLDDILYCTSDNNYTSVHVRGDKKPVVVSRPLSEFDAFLGGQGFVRIHQSHLINRKHIRRYVKGEGGEVIMGDGANLPVSRRQKAGLMEALERL
ncbi:MAG: response regulator transcription factor [Flavobacteriales bacterium]|nr:Sensory transduction protein LytR [Flavobacteriales bacterium]MCC6576570.1 response regulator transcription factor [Flavobacteriales bacterium]NUQ15690.1 response regulator transcription factor [Flavobacteriales bacterium]